MDSCFSVPPKKKNIHVVSGPEALPVQGHGLIPLPENVLDLVGRNQGEWGSKLCLSEGERERDEEVTIHTTLL